MYLLKQNDYLFVNMEIVLLNYGKNFLTHKKRIIWSWNNYIRTSLSCIKIIMKT